MEFYSALIDEEDEGVCDNCERLEKRIEMLRATLNEIKKVVGTSTLQWKLANHALVADDSMKNTNED